MDESRNNLDRILEKIRQFVLLAGHDAVPMALSGDRPEGPRAQAISELRTNLEKYCSESGYWRANLHLASRPAAPPIAEGGGREPTAIDPERHNFHIQFFGAPRAFHPWRPGLSPTRPNSGLRLPFIDLATAQFRSSESRMQIEKTSRWYAKFNAGSAPGVRSTSRLALNWLDWQNQSAPRPNDSAVIRIRPGEIFFVLMLVDPELLPIRDNPFVSLEDLSDDGRAAFARSARDSDSPLAMAVEVLQWLDLKHRVFDCRFRDELLERLGAPVIEGLDAALNSVTDRTDTANFIEWLKTDKAFALARRAVTALTHDYPYLRFRPEEPVLSGTRALVLWPVTGGPSWSAMETHGQFNDIYCIVALQPFVQDIDNRSSDLIAFIERLLLHTVPGAVVFEMRGQRSVEAFRAAYHQVKSIAVAARSILSPLTGPNGSTVTALLDSFSISFRAWMAFSERTTTNTPIPQPLAWMWPEPNSPTSFGTLLAQAFSRPEQDVAGFTVKVSDDLLKNTMPDVRVFGISWELLNNAQKWRVLRLEDPHWNASGRSGAAHLSFVEDQNAIRIECVSQPHLRRDAIGLRKRKGPHSNKSSMGVEFITALCADLDCTLSEDAWEIAPRDGDSDDWVTVTFRCELPKSRFFPKPGDPQ